MMNRSSTSRYCRCGIRLEGYSSGGLCNPCEKKLAALRVEAPDVPANFWEIGQLRDAFAAQHIGQISRAYRKHPHHLALYGKDIPQEVVGGWLGLTQAQVSRIENGPPVRHLDNLAHWARTLHIPAHLLWFNLPEQRPGRQAHESTRPASEGDLAPAIVGPSPQELAETDDMNRRELLRLVSLAGTLLATSSIEGWLDWERIDYFANRTGRPDSATIDEHATLNAHLWRVFASSRSKSATFPSVREQLDVLTNSLRQSHGTATHQRLCALIGDLFQLAGEIFFDGNQYTDAAHCYTLAASASKEASAFDLWACAMTRHAYIGVYERQFDRAAPMIELAAGLARRGDHTLSTRHWVSAVQAEAFAGLGDLEACQRALDSAEEIHELNGPVHNGGWLRFDGSRLAEERGTCYVELGRPDLAEVALTDALRQDLSTRRRGIVLSDLAMIGAQRRDPEHLVMYGDAALDAARQTGSGVIGRKLQRLQSHLGPFLSDSHVRHLSKQITTLTGNPTPG